MSLKMLCLSTCARGHSDLMLAVPAERRPARAAAPRASEGPTSITSVDSGVTPLTENCSFHSGLVCPPAGARSSGGPGAVYIPGALDAGNLP